MHGLARHADRSEYRELESPAEHRNMRLVCSILFSVLLLPPGVAFAQSASPQFDSSSAIATAPGKPAEDSEFASFEPVVSGIKPPKAVWAPDPKFPELPEGAEPRGTVVLLIGVNTKGHVEPVRVLRSDEAAFEKSAVSTVKKWKFKPATQDGHPVPVQITVEMHFAK